MFHSKIYLRWDSMRRICCFKMDYDKIEFEEQYVKDALYNGLQWIDSYCESGIDSEILAFRMYEMKRIIENQDVSPNQLELKLKWIKNS